MKSRIKCIVGLSSLKRVFFTFKILLLNLNVSKVCFYFNVLTQVDGLKRIDGGGQKTERKKVEIGNWLNTFRDKKGLRKGGLKGDLDCQSVCSK